jgi:hypothetical protein
MKSQAGMIAAALLATVVLSAATASAPSAADEWFIGGTKLSQLSSKNAPLSMLVPVDEFSTITLNPLGGASEVRMKCEGTNISAATAYISAGGGGMAKSLVFEKCKIAQPTSNCELEKEGTGPKNLRNIETNALGITTLLVGSPTKVGINLKPLTGKVFVALKLAETNTCLGGATEAPVNGSVLILSSDGPTEATVHTLMAQGSLENNSLEIGGDKTIIEGGLALAKLANTANWSFHA